MSPEQASGRIDDVDERTDVYGLGAILFTILSGKAPHEATSRKSDSTPNSIEELLSAIVKNPTPSPRSVEPSVPVELSEICQRAMSKRKYGRYSSAVEMANAVQAWTVGIARRTRRFEEMRAQTRELEVRITAAAEDIVRTVRFISALPPIQGIVDAELAREGCEPFETWQLRLQTIIEGLLRTSQDILSVSIVSIDSDVTKELFRVERYANDLSFIRATPSSRLVEWSSCQLVDSVKELEPGDARFGIIESPRNTQRTVGGKKLMTVLPIYDNTDGCIFGFVAIETNLAQIIRQAVHCSNKAAASLVIADESGMIWYDNASLREGSRASELEQAYLMLYEMNEKKHRNVDDGSTFIARRVELGDFDDQTALLVMACIKRSE